MSEEWAHIGIVGGEPKVRLENVQPAHIGTLIGYLMVAVGMEMVKSGADLDMIKSGMWDVYDGAMASLEDNVRDIPEERQEV